jgi:tetratricopeptide (TPR) repeat protein
MRFESLWTKPNRPWNADGADKPNRRVKVKASKLSIMMVISIAGLVGCQSLSPFQSSATRKSMTQRLSQQWTNLGLDALNTGRLGQAKSFFARATAENPKDQLARINLARTLRQEGDLAAAIEQMQQGLELSGNLDPQLITELGEMQLQAGRWLPAQQQAELAIKLDHRCGSAWALRGRLHHARGESEAALTAFQRAVSLDPNLTEVQLEIASVYQATNQPLRALSAIEKVLHRFPPDQQPESALLAKGEVLIQLQQLNTALEVLQLASERTNPSREVFLRLAQAQIMRDEISQARLTLNRGLERYPLDAECAELLGQLPTDMDQIVVR